jgi:hypothetical protein
MTCNLLHCWLVQHCDCGLVFFAVQGARWPIGMIGYRCSVNIEIGVTSMALESRLSRRSGTSDYSKSRRNIAHSMYGYRWQRYRKGFLRENLLCVVCLSE